MRCIAKPQNIKWKNKIKSKITQMTYNTNTKKGAVRKPSPRSGRVTGGQPEEEMKEKGH